MAEFTDSRCPKFGEIYYMRFDGTGSEQTGWRPGLVFQNNVGNLYSPNIIALPLTSSLKKRNIPTHVVIYADSTDLKYDSMILCENPSRMSKSKIGQYIMTISDEDKARVAAASLLASSAISYIEPDDLLSLWQKALEINICKSNSKSTATI